MDKGSTTRPGAFEARFRGALRHLRWRSVVHGSAIVLPWLQASWLALFAGRRLGLVAWPDARILGGLAAILAATLAYRLWRLPGGRDAALVLDRGLGTRELVTAAQEEPALADRSVARLARRRAAAALARPRVKAALPLTGWRGWRPAILGLVAILLAPLVPVRQTGATAAEAIDPVVERTAEQLAEELEPLADDPVLEERPEAAEALARLQEMVEAMRDGEMQTVDEALIAMTRLEETVHQLTRSESGRGFDDLVRDLADEPLSADLARAMTEADAQALRESLERLAGALTAPEALQEAMQRQVERLADRLAELAELLAANGERELGEALRELVEALADGDLEKAAELLRSEEVGGACRVGGSQAGGERLSAALAELTQLGRYLLGRDPRGGRSPGAADVQPFSASGAGPRPGTTTSDREAASYAAGDPLLRDRRSAATADWQEEFEALYESRLESGGGADVRFDGQVGAGGEMLSQTGRGLGVRGGGSLPLRPFATPGAGAEEQGADLESVPLGYRDLVRRYFERRDAATRDAAGGRSEPLDPPQTSPGGER